MTNNGYTYPDLIQACDEGVTVTAFYSRRYPHSTEEAWRERIRTGQVARNGRTPGRTGYLLHSWKIRFPHPGTGERVEVVCPPAGSGSAILTQLDSVETVQGPRAAEIAAGVGDHRGS
jgi:hypothetical protein